MKKLPSIYKNSIDVHNNLMTFYSKNDSLKQRNSNDSLESSKRNLTVQEAIHEIFSNKQYSYTKRVRVMVQGKVFETRFIKENQGNILTIDNEIISISDIDSIDILS